MKKTILGLMLVLVGGVLHAQIYVNGILLDDLSKGRYLEIDEKRISGEYSIIMNYGQAVWDKRNLDVLTDEKGDVIKFKNIVGALNHFDDNGWEFKEYYIVENLMLDRKYLLIRKG